MSDSENKEALLKLMRYHTTFSVADNSSMVSLDDYIKKMKQGQSKIYFIAGQSKEHCLNNPFMEVFKDSGVPVLFLTNNVDEVCFQQIGDYKTFKFHNIECPYEEYQKDIGDTKLSANTPSLPEDDTTSFVLWLKNELQSYVQKVTISKRLVAVPCVLYGQVSSSMRMVMQMME